MNPFNTQRWWGYLPLFDPAVGTSVVEPEQEGRGWWVGAPSVMYDPGTGVWWLYYRVRRPRELGRGVECRIARSRDGVHFETAWRAGKAEFDSPSVERGCLIRDLDGAFRLFVGYVDGADNRWRIDQIVADAPDGFDPSKRTKALAAPEIGAEGVKDPWVVVIGRLYTMLVSYAPSAGDRRVTAEQLHGTADVYNTGITKSHTGLATSADCDRWEWHGDVLSPPDSGWDSYATRLGCLVWTPPVFTGFYDGSASVDENYEERTGLVTSMDLRSFTRVTPDGPALVSPHGSGSLRYLDALVQGGHLWCYYEYAREDGSHELRLNRVPWPYSTT